VKLRVKKRNLKGHKERGGKDSFPISGTGGNSPSYVRKHKRNVHCEEKFLLRKKEWRNVTEIFPSGGQGGSTVN